LDPLAESGASSAQNDPQYDKATAYTKVKSSGVLGAGLGIMVGTQKMQDNYEGEFKTQIGTTIGSSEGSVTIAAGDTAHLTTTDMVGKTGVEVAAQDMILDGKQNEAHERQTHEESMSGLTIGLSSPVMEAAEGLRSTIRTAQTRDNKTLQALEAYEGGKTLNDQIQNMKQGGIGSVGIHVGIGSSSFKQEYQKDTVTYAGGTLASEGTITLAAGSEDTAKGNIKAIGETIQGQNVTLAASHDIDLGAATNTQTIAENYNSKGSSLRMTITGGAISGVDASFSKEKGRRDDGDGVGYADHAVREGYEYYRFSGRWEYGKSRHRRKSAHHQLAGYGNVSRKQLFPRWRYIRIHVVRQ